MSPTTFQKQTKVRFHRLVKDNPMLDLESMSIKDIAEVCKEPQVLVWLKDDTFRAWFKDSKVLVDKVALGAEQAVDKLLQIINATEVGPNKAVTISNQLTAAKALLNMAGVAAPSKSEVKVSADQLPQDEKKLREYIKNNAAKLKVLEKVK